MCRKKVVTAFSGGKDSTAAIILLKENNYDVHALTMKIGIKYEEERIEKIKKLAKILEVSLKIVDLSIPFKKKVIDYFINSYASGRTPNPCMVCNNEIKFNLLMDEILKNEKTDFFATGHYADKIKINGDYFLREPADKEKSQIYFLSMIGKKRLKNINFPLSNVGIKRVKQIVEGLPLGNKRESQDVCFLQDQSLMDYLKMYIPEKFVEGNILDVNGEKIGTHKGSISFTIGQRRGTNYSSGKKLYVVKKDVENNTITLGEEKYLYSDSIKVAEPVFWKKLEKGEFFNVKVRYLSEFFEGEIIEVSNNLIKAKFKKPVKAVTPGQIGVFYKNNIIVAAGFIV